jgi:Family of unknown function (DUF5331)
MNIQELRQSLKLKWLNYYKENRHWLEKMQIWATFEDERRPLSSFVLATVSVLEPNLIEILPLIADLNSDPDEVMVALGLNFNPEKFLHLIESEPKKNQVTENKSKFDCCSESLLQKQAEVTAAANSTFVESKSNHHNNPDIKVAVATAYLNQVQSLQSVTVPATTHPQGIYVTASKVGQAKPILALATTTPDGSKIVKILHSRIPGEVNQSPITSRKNLANWIDDFCQGAGWDKDEAIFIPF